MRGDWKESKFSPSIDVRFIQSPKAEIQPKIVAMIERMRREQVAMLEGLATAYDVYLDGEQLKLLSGRIDWHSKYCDIYYRDAQMNIYWFADNKTAKAIEPIIISYNKVMAKLHSKLAGYDGEEKVEAIMHLVDWIADAPHRFALRLLQFKIDILEPSVRNREDKEGYLQKGTVPSCSFFT